MNYGEYFERIIDEGIIEQIAEEGKTMTDSGLLDFINQVCKEEKAEVVWSFGGFPRIILFRRIG